MSSKKNLYLHIGLRKTGTTYIQSFCQLNQTNLMELGYFYPDNDVFDERKGKSPGHWNLHKVFEGLESRYPLEHYLLGNLDAENIILSNEALTSEHCNTLGIAEKVQNMLPGDLRVRVIVYLRRQDSYLNSLYHEGIISGNLKSAMSFSEFLDSRDFLELDYNNLLASWSKFFGKENITVRPFEKQQFFKGDLIRDFLHCIGIKWNKNFIRPPKESINASPNIELIESIRHLNRIPMQKRPMYKKFIEDVFDELAFNQQNNNMITQSHFSPKERDKILTFYSQSNAKVAREFLDRKDGKLFSDPDPKKDTQWQPIKITDTDLVTRILSIYLEQKTIEITKNFSECKTLINEQQNQIQELQYLIGTLEKTQNEISTLRNNARKTFEEHRESLRKKDQEIDENKKKCQHIQDLLYMQILTTYIHSRKSIWRRLYRFLRYWRLNETKLLHRSGLVDPHYYFSMYPDTITGGMSPARHYVRFGAMEGRNPSNSFNTKKYLAEHPDVAHNGLNPLAHFILKK